MSKRRTRRKFKREQHRWRALRRWVRRTTGMVLSRERGTLYATAVFPSTVDNADIKVTLVNDPVSYV